MKSLRLKNFRNLLDTQHIEIKPITLLVGGNGSGKSSFLRFMPLLKQSYKVASVNPVIWYDKSILDFGSFREVVTANDIKQCIYFSFCFEREAFQYLSGHNFANYPFRFLKQKDLPDITLSLEISWDQKSEIENIKSLEILFEDQSILIECDSSGVVHRLLVNNRDVLIELNNQYICMLISGSGLVPDLVFRKYLDKNTDEDTDFLDFYSNGYYYLVDRSLSSLLRKKVKETLRLRNNINSQNLGFLINGFINKLGSSNAILESYKEFAVNWDERRNSATSKKLRDRIAAWDQNSNDFQTIRDFSIAVQAISILKSCASYLRSFSERIFYIGPLRATAERYYRYSQSMVDEVNPNGDNLAMILKNFTAKERTNFSKWTRENFRFSVDAESNEHHIRIIIQDTKDSKKVNLADTGSGFAQILPIITQLWKIINSGKTDQKRVFTIAIEQPELHLHPRFQGLLVDTLIDSINVAKTNGVNLKFILETHSPIFINRFGHQISEGKLSQDDINVVLFEKDEKTGNADVKTTSYDEDGFLEYWPIGFLEADLT